ncbi:MAG: phospho-N-acetylmuramoyl-pentapeptide-transferase [Selenomonadaceae bacterium]|nr:phospho-N-acetylmuramoyl-pentapeptide-transferase [Selenomonadaceae bacterium]
MENIFYPGAAIVLAAVLVLLAGPRMIPELHKLKFGQSIREEGPKSHQAKSGTPTMGGIMIILSIAITSMVLGNLSLELVLALIIMLGHFVLGFVDDYIKVVKKHNLGLKAKQKLLGQIIIAVLVAYFAGLPTDLWVPFAGNIDLGYGFYVLILLVLVGTSNAVNLTDGLDGLASGTVIFAALTYMAICLALGKMDLAIFCGAMAGACLGFLKFNAHPAKIFMGDTGSLALGGAIAAAGILTHTEILLVVVGLVFVCEAMSVIIQVISFKTTGKRVFLMSPIHHHFELKGWAETKVVKSFCFAGALSGLLGWLLFRVG